MKDFGIGNDSRNVDDAHAPGFRLLCWGMVILILLIVFLSTPKGHGWLVWIDGATK
jgi:hypothetical protein